MTKDMKKALEAPAIVEGLRWSEAKAFKGYSKRAFGIYEKMHGNQPDVFFQATMGQMYQYHAQMEACKAKGEGVSQGSMPFLRDYGFELITVLFPGLIANDLFNVQPAKFKNYSIFYQNYLHANAKANTAAASRMIGSLQADGIDPNYTLDAEVDKTIGTGNGAATAFTVAASTLYRPLIAGTISIVATKADGTVMTVVDNGAGVLTGDVGAGANTVDYVTGAIAVDFAAAAKNASAVLLTYTYAGEGSETNAMEMDMTISEIPGQAKERRLRFNYSIESQFSYKQQFGRSMDADLLAAGIADVRAEIDADLIVAGANIANVQSGANACAGAVTWDRTPDQGVQYHFWREQFIDTLRSGGNLILGATDFGDGNKVVGGLNFKQVVETIGQRAKVVKASATDKGARKIATLDDSIDCYYSPKLGANDFYITYKGGPLQVGLSYNPWMPLYTSEPHMLDNGKLHRYLMTAYGKVAINRKLFVKGTLTKS